MLVAFIPCSFEFFHTGPARGWRVPGAFGTRDRRHAPHATDRFHALVAKQKTSARNPPATYTGWLIQWCTYSVEFKAVINILQNN